MDAKSVFTDNMVYDTAEVYGGGGAIYLGYTPSGTTVQIQGAFNRNKARRGVLNCTFSHA